MKTEESALVGCLLLEPDKCADEIFTQLEDNVFANQYAKECFKACETAYYENSGKFDSATIITKQGIVTGKQIGRAHV